MTTRSRGRALQEITNVEDQEKQPAKKQRSDPTVDVSKSATTGTTRVTRRRSLTAAAAAAAAENNNPDPSLQSPPSKVTTSQSQTKSKPVAPTVSKITTNTPRSTEPHNDLNISLDSVTSSVSSAKKSSRKRKKRSDPTQCLEIISLMYDRYYQQEEKFRVQPYIHKHSDINQKMRSILVDWLVEVHFKFRLQPPTLWLCVNILDRYLNIKVLPRNRLQLLGVASLLISCKFEEIFPPEVQDCVYITDQAYTKLEVLAMEQLVLETLDYQLCVPTGYHFLTRYLNLIHASDIVKYLAFYYAERNLQEADSLAFKPSLLAAAALYAALVQQSEQSLSTSHHSDTSSDDADVQSIWPDILIEECDYDERDLLPVAKVLIKHVGEEPVTTSMRRLIAVKKKYLNDKYHQIADFGLPTFPEDNPQQVLN